MTAAKKSRAWRSRMLVLYAFAIPAAAIAQTPPSADDLQALSDRIVKPGIDAAGVPRAIVGISLHGRRFYFGYSGTGEAPLDRDAIVEIGSITKVFSTTLLAGAFASGTIKPDQSIGAYLPGVPLRPCTAKITPVELADFTSGLRELPDDVPQRLERRGIEYYTPSDFLHWLSRTVPRTGCALPAPYLYSNASVGLLGPILANVTGRSWATLVADEITGPLAMSDTAISPTRSARVQGHRPDGQPAPPWPVFAWYAAGALRSTAQDMLAFGEAALGHETVNGRTVPQALSQAFHTAMRPVYQREGLRSSVGLSWQSEPDGAGGRITYKNGGTEGFNSVIVVDPTKDCAIFIVANKSGTGISDLGIDLMRAIGR